MGLVGRSYLSMQHKYQVYFTNAFTCSTLPQYPVPMMSGAVQGMSARTPFQTLESFAAARPRQISNPLREGY